MEIVVILILIFIFENIHWDIQAVIFFSAIIALLATPNLFLKNTNSEKSSDNIFCITFSCVFFLTCFICFFSKHIIMAIISLIIGILLTTGIKKQTRNKLKNEKIDCPDNTIILSNPKKLGFGYIFYNLTINYEYESKKKSHKIENVSLNNFKVYKKENDNYKCIFPDEIVRGNEQGNIVIPLTSTIDDYCIFFVIARKIADNEFTRFTNPYTGDDYIEDFVIFVNSPHYVYAENYERIIGFNQNMECLYSTYNNSKSDKASLYLWQPDKGETCLTKDFMYGLYYDFSNRHFCKSLKYLFKEDNFINIYFYKKDCNSYYILMELAKQADSFEILPNKFKDDDTINYRVKFDKKRVDDIALFYYSMDRVMTYYSNQTAANYGLFYNNSTLDTCGGTAIYNIPFIDYFKGLEGKLKVFNTISQFQLSQMQKDYFKNLVKIVYSNYDLPVNYDYLPECFVKDCIFEDLQYENLRNFLNKEFVKAHEIYNFKTFADVLKEKCKDRYNLIKQDLIARKIIKSKWKSELELFRLVYQHYPTAIYQYHSDWLGLQSLDIYIPDLRIGIEYQGEQHYKVVEHFDGEEGFKKRQELDNRKRQLCVENKIKLIEWRFDEPINQMNLENKIKNIEVECEQTF
jgi:hypothetical protein|nr:MAG TPA: restriction enzyme [Bacteriophage sp.]